VWTPRDQPEDWIAAKLWVRCADFHLALGVAHLLKTHLVVEPFVIAMMRQLSSSHPLYKLLKPHFRYESHLYCRCPWSMSSAFCWN